jgi:hypothetical protein
MAILPHDLPNYRHPCLASLDTALQTCFDVWNGLYGCKENYLHKSPQEPMQAYQRRLGMSVFNNKYRSLIEAVSGLLTAFDMQGLPATFGLAEDEGHGVDGQGSDFKGFFRTADEMAMRDGSVYILTNNAQLSLEEDADRTAADPLTHPQWTLVDRRNMLNWRTELRQGRQILTQCTIRVNNEVPMGEYGTAIAEQYHVLKLLDSGVELTVWEIGDRGQLNQIGQAQTVPLERIPLRAYPDITEPFPDKENPQIPHLLKAAELNVKLFQQESNLATIQYRVNAPTVWRSSSLPMEQRSPIIFGPNHVIEIMRDSSTGTQSKDEVGVLELAGSGVEKLMISCEETRKLIDEEGLGFLGNGGVQRSATEAYLSSARASSTVDGWARAKTQAIHALIEDWCMFSGENPDTAEVEMDSSVLETPLDASEVAQLLALWSAGAIDHATLLGLLKLGRQLPRDASVEEILERVAAERAASIPAMPEIINGILMPAEGEPE